jgi:hypothetical protein
LGTEPKLHKTFYRVKAGDTLNIFPQTSCSEMKTVQLPAKDLSLLIKKLVFFGYGSKQQTIKFSFNSSCGGG